MSDFPPLSLSLATYGAVFSRCFRGLSWAAALLALTSVPTAARSAEGDQQVAVTPSGLISNGDFETDAGSDGWPDDWGNRTEGNGITWESEADRHFLRLAVQAPGRTQMVERTLPLAADSKGLVLTVRYRSADLAAKAARVQVVFRDARKRILTNAATPLLLAPAVAWTTVTSQLPIPSTAVDCVVLSGLFGAEVGRVDLDEVQLVASETRITANSADPVPLNGNGDFSKAAAADWPSGWGNKPEGMSWESEGDRRFVRVTQQKPGAMHMLMSEVALTGQRGITIAIGYRTDGIEKGSQSWFDARTIINFLDADGKTVSDGSPIIFSGKAKTWSDAGNSMQVPVGAVRMRVMAGLFQAKAGTVDFTSFKVYPLSGHDVDGLIAMNDIAAQRRAEEQAAADQRLDARLDEQLAATGNLLGNGDFETNGKRDWPEGWGSGPSKGVEALTEDGRRFMRLTQLEEGKLLMLYRIIPLRTGIRGLEISVRYRTADLKRGSQMPGDARLIGHFLSGKRSGRMEDGKTLSPEPPTLGFSGNATEWTEVTRRCLVPEGATKLQLMPGLWFAKAGRVDLDSIRIAPMSDSDVDAMNAEIASKQAAKDARAAVIADIMALPPISSELRVNGNRVHDADGKDAWLQGLCVDSMQWSMGENILWSIHTAMDDWKANVIRLPVNEAFWFGTGKGQPAGGEKAYRKLVDDAVALVAARGGHLVLDLHSFGHPTEKHRAFWNDAAVRYANNPTVLFELFNEPHGISWKLWRDGGSLDSKENVITDVGAAENTEKIESKSTIGVQALVDCVREAGAKNILIMGGLDYSYDLTGVAGEYALDDRGGNGIIYVSHIYPWKSDWQGKVLIAAEKYPIILTEVGCQPKPMPWQKTTEDPATWAPDMLGLIQKHHLHWTGFSFHPTCGPNAISDWNYTPTPYWGAYAKDALAGKSFELKRMR